MSNKKQLLEMRRRKAALEAKLNKIRESRAKSGLAYLIENELEKAEVVLAAKAIVEKLAKMAEDLAKVMGDDVMPLMDTLKTTYGPQMADSFQKAANQTLQAVTQSVTQAKDHLSTEIGKFESALGGGEGSDMANYADAAAPAAGGMEPDASGFNAAAPADAGMDAGMGDEGGMADVGDDFGTAPGDDADTSGDDAAIDDLFADDAGKGPASGRARKESFRRRGKALNEGLLDSMKSYLGSMASKAPAQGSPRERLEALKPFLTAEDYEIVAQFPDQLLKTIFDSLDQTNATAMAPVAAAGAPVMGAPPAPAPAPMGGEMGLGGGMGVDPVDDMMAQDELGDVGMDDPMGDMDADMAMGGDMDADMEMSPEESILNPMKQLGESRNPDRMIFNSFRRRLKEGLTPLKAAKQVAETYAIDFADVVQIVKEGRVVKEGKKGVNPFAKKDDKKADKKDEKKDAKKDGKKSDKKDDKLPAFLKKGKEKVDEYFFHDGPEMKQARERGKPQDVLGRRPDKAVAKHGQEYKAMKKHQKPGDHYGIGGPKGKLPEDAPEAKKPAAPAKAKPSFKPAANEKAGTLDNVKPSDRLAKKIGDFEKALGKVKEPTAEPAQASRPAPAPKAQAARPAANPAQGKTAPAKEPGQARAKKPFEKHWEGNQPAPQGDGQSSIPHAQRSVTMMSKQVPVGEAYQNGNDSSSQTPPSGNSAAPTPSTPLTPASSSMTNTPAPQPTAKPAPKPTAQDQQKAQTLAAKLQATPNLKPEDLGDAVAKNISSIGKQGKDVPTFTDMVNQQLVNQGVFKESARRNRK